MPLDNVAIELRDEKGKVIRRATTANTAVVGLGGYVFTGLTPGGRYFVTPITRRREFASPTQIPVTVPAGGSFLVDPIKIGGVRTKVTVNQAPTGTMILLTPTPYTEARPPASSAMSSKQALRVSGTDNKAVMEVEVGTAYDIVCWKPQSANGNTIRHQRIPNVNSTLVINAPLTGPTVVNCP
jgi:hypothetical protein